MAPALSRTGPPARPGRGRGALSIGLLGAAILLAVLAVGPRLATSGARDAVAILASEPATLDPARQGDHASAAITAQLYETLTAFDPGLTPRPALAAGWTIDEGGRRIVFHLRPGLTFSDGSPLGAEDVVRSWLRLVDPRSPSPLASLLDDVVGARDRRLGRADEAAVGLRASGRDVEVRLGRPMAGEFAAIVASPTFGVVPPGIERGVEAGPGFVGSGGYRLVESTADALVLEANERYWAGAPAIGRVRVVTSTGGRGPVQLFVDGEVDFAPLTALDAGWVAYDPELGPALREVPSLSVTFYGFDTAEPPFDDARVRRAFAQAVDWDRIVELASYGDDVPATSLVPPGIPGRSERDFSPVHDPDAARRLLAEAGYPGGRGLRPVTLATSYPLWDAAIVAQLEATLGVDVAYEQHPFEQLSERLASDPPDVWSLGWVADYPGRNDFLGILAGCGASNNYARWCSDEFEAAIARAGAAADPRAAAAAYDEAEAILQAEAPLLPVAYSAGWALSREGLLGATDNGLGIVRFAGLAWADR